MSPGKLSLMKKELTMLGILVGLVILTAILKPGIFLSGDNLRTPSATSR